LFFRLRGNAVDPGFPMRIAQIVLAAAAFSLSLGLSILWKWSRPASYHDSWPVDSALNAFFHETHEENTAAFIRECAALKSHHARAASLPLPGKENGLAIDLCHVPAAGNLTSRLIVVTSGIHGSEALAGSAVQRMFMRDLAGQKEHPAFLFVHGINAYGARNFRRVTENNVDLNRNFDVSEALFRNKNEGYAKILELSNPEGPADAGTLKNRFFALVAVTQIVQKGMSALRQAILQGQYEYPKGIYFGGFTFEPQKKLLEPVFREAAAGKEFVAAIDLHTGYGERGTTHLFPNTPDSPQMKELTDKLYEGWRVEYAEPGETFYAVHGDFSVFLGRLLEPNTRYVPMVFEYGTLDSNTTPGAIRSFHNTVLENQGFHYGCIPEDCGEIKSRYREMFYPSSPSWRSKILRDSPRTVRPRP
jgi:hypothetical protein